mgnify:CR=1 FL=1
MTFEELKVRAAYQKESQEVAENLKIAEATLVTTEGEALANPTRATHQKMEAARKARDTMLRKHEEMLQKYNKLLFPFLKANLRSRSSSC